MRLLLDTHILLSFLADSPSLPAQARTLITDPANETYVSAINFWEIAIKAKLGKLNVQPAHIHSATVDTWVFPDRFFQSDDALVAGSLPDLHRDPFDRALIAQASREPYRLLTHDSVLTQYGSVALLV